MLAFNMASSRSPRNRGKTGGLLWLLFPWVLVALVILFFPFRFAFELDADEGVDLVKSVLVAQGSKLYTDVWSDQPPLFTYFIAAIFKLFGVKLTLVRLMILMSSCALFWAAVQYLRAFWGASHAVVGGVVLILLPAYLRLSVSVMFGLPAISLAMLALLATCYWHKEGKKLWLVLSGLALAASVMTKLFTGLLAPLLIAGLIIQEWQGFRKTGSWRVLLTPAVIWAFMFGTFTLLIGLVLIYPDGPSQLLLNHWMAQSIEFPNPETIAGYLGKSLPVILLGVIGGVHVIRKRRWTGLYMLAWALVGFLLLSQTTPVWYHHQLLVTVPTSVLGGIALGESLVAIRSRFRNRQGELSLGALQLVTAILIPFLVASILTESISDLDYRLPNLIRPQETRREMQAQNLLAAMRKYADATTIIVTDRPMLAIKLGKPVPPELAALTGKRLLTGELSENEIISTIVKYQPEQVALARFELAQVDAYLRQHYRLVHEVTDHRLYVRSDLQVDR
jgi:4-amino-4-deoxy-L-arabinose transferase-like glycosyltransferase